MKLLKPLLFVSLFFIFNSFTTEPKTPINKKVTFNAEYLVNSSQFLAFDNLLSNTPNLKTEDDIINFQTKNSELIASINTIVEETNFLELNDNEIERVFENYYSNSTPQKVEDICRTMAYLMYQLTLIQCGNTNSCQTYAINRLIYDLFNCP